MDSNPVSTMYLRGYLEKEDEEVNTFVKRFCILDKTKNAMLCYREDPKTAKFPDPVIIIEIQYVTKIEVCTQKSKRPYCFEISTANKRFYFAAPTESAMLLWANELHKAAVNPKQPHRTTSDCSGMQSRSQTNPQQQQQESFCPDTSFQTSIVGGVVVKAPAVKRQESSSHGVGSIIEGWCWKQGARMKNWKHRYFTLTVIKLCYFENKEDKEPIRSIPVQVLEKTKEASGYCNRSNILEVVTPSRTFFMQLETPEELLRWKEAIDSVILTVPDEQRRGLSL